MKSYLRVSKYIQNWNIILTNKDITIAYKRITSNNNLGSESQSRRKQQQRFISISTRTLPRPHPHTDKPSISLSLSPRSLKFKDTSCKDNKEERLSYARSSSHSSAIFRIISYSRHVGRTKDEVRATEGGGKEARVAHERKKTKTKTKRKETEKEELARSSPSQRVKVDVSLKRY